MNFENIFVVKIRAFYKNRIALTYELKQRQQI